MLFSFLLQIHIILTKHYVFNTHLAWIAQHLSCKRIKTKVSQNNYMGKVCILKKFIILDTIYWLVITKNLVFNTNRSKSSGPYRPKKSNRIAYETRIGKWERYLETDLKVFKYFLEISSPYVRGPSADANCSIFLSHAVHNNLLK